MAADNGFDFTATERRLYNVLKDLQPHLPNDLRKLLNDDQACPETLLMHISNMRNKIEGKGLTIFTLRDRRVAYYQMGRRLADAQSE